MSARTYDVIIIGGGAAGFFAAINLAEARPELRIAILERGKETLQKVKISGGGRCNVTHACWDPKELVEFYARGSKELLGPFNKFCTGDTVDWFEQHGIELKIEDDGRMFPASNSSQTIIDCFESAVKVLGIDVIKSTNVIGLEKSGSQWQVLSSKGVYNADYVVVAPGSSKAVWRMFEKLGHKIVDPVPSLFTFNCKDTRLRNMAGSSVSNAQVEILDTKLQANGPLLVTHWGLSGPAILRLSAWGARTLEKLNYKFKIRINFTGAGLEQVAEVLKHVKANSPKKQMGNLPQFEIPKRLWQQLLGNELALLSYGSLSEHTIRWTVNRLCAAEFNINGKSTFKDEFVTAGGVELSEVDFRTMESKMLESVYFAGEVLNIDAVTGGFNFQAAWTTAWLLAQAIAKK